MFRVDIVSDRCRPAQCRRRLQTPDAPVSWLFLSGDAARARAWEQQLGGGFVRRQIGRHLDSAARSLRPAYGAWIDDLNGRHRATRGWFLTRLSERNTLASPVFRQACYLFVVRELLANPNPPRLIVAETPGLAAAIARIVRAAGHRAHRRRRWREALQPAVRWVTAALAPFGTTCPQAWAAWRSRRGARAWAPAAPPTIVKTFFHAVNMESHGQFRDRYLGGLEEHLQAPDRPIWILPLLADRSAGLAKQYVWMRQSAARFLVPEDWLRPSDYAGAIIDAWISRISPVALPPVSGLDLMPLVREDSVRAAGPACAAALLQRLPRRLAEAGIRPYEVIAWSENQLHDKGFASGCRAVFPDVPYTAVQNTPLPPNLLNLFPLRSECESRLAPIRQVCSGPMPAAILERESGGALETVVACGLRYRYLWEIAAPSAQRPAGPLSIVILLPAAFSTVKEILDAVAPVSVKHPAWCWQLKAHPDHTIGMLRAACEQRGLAHFQLTDLPLRACFELADAVITAGSGTALEALVFGVPVLQMGSQTELNLDALAWFDDASLGANCYDSADFEAELNRLGGTTAQTRSMRRDRGLAVRDAWFAQVTPEALDRFSARAPRS